MSIPIHERNPPQIGGNMIPFNHVNFLEWLACWIKPQVYVEYGVASGQVLEAVSRHAVTAHGVDIQPYEPKNKNIIFHQESTRDAIQWLQNIDIDFAFIDADHDPDMAMQDFRDVYARLVPNGFVCIHDTYPTIPVMLDPSLCNLSYLVPHRIQKEYPNIELVTFPFCPGLTIVKKAHVLPFMDLSLV